MRRAILAAVLVRAILAAVLFLNFGESAFLSPDSLSYLPPAESLVARGTFDGPTGAPELFRTPGYPLLLTLGVVLGQPVAFAIAMNVLMAAMIVALTYRLASWGAQLVPGAPPTQVPRLTLGMTAGRCALVVALEPTMLMWSLKVMPETLLTLLLVAFAMAALRAIETCETRWIIAAAALLACAAYVKPIVYPLVIIMVVLAAFYGAPGERRRPAGRSTAGPAVRARENPPASRRWTGRPAAGAPQAFLFLLTAVLIIAPWHFRNAQHGYRGFSTLAEQAIYAGVGGTIAARHEHVPYGDMRTVMFQRVQQQRPGARPAMMWREGWRLLFSDPPGYSWTHAQGMLRTLFDPGAVEYLRIFGRYPRLGGALARIVDQGLVRGAIELARAHPLVVWSSAVMAIALAPLVVLPFVGVTRVPRDRRTAFVLFAIITAWLVFAGGGVPGSSRFRAPAVPFLTLMSAFAFRRDAKLAAR